MKKIMNTHIIENHDEALEIWDNLDEVNFSLYHFDAHFDYGNISKTQEVNIGNFIQESIRRGIITRFIWIIPLPSFEISLVLDSIKTSLKEYLYEKLEMLKDGTFRGILKIDETLAEFILCSTIHVGDLIKKDTKYLIDIDIDFLVNPYITIIPYSHIFYNSLWIQPRDLIRLIYNNSCLITIARSVVGGFTPLRYGFLAEMLRDLFLRKETKHYDNMILGVKAMEDKNFKKAIIYLESCITNDEIANYARYAIIELAIITEDSNLLMEHKIHLKDSFNLRYILNIQQFLNMNLKKHACKCIKKWLKIEMDSGQLAKLAAQLYLNQKFMKKKFLELLGYDSEGKFYLGCIYYKNKQYKSAIKYLQQSLNDLKNNYYDWEGVISYYKHIHQITPVKLTIYNLLADSYYKDGNYQQGYIFYCMLIRCGYKPKRQDYFHRLLKKLKKNKYIQKNSVILNIKTIIMLIRNKHKFNKTYKYLYSSWEVNVEKYKAKFLQ